MMIIIKQWFSTLFLEPPTGQNLPQYHFVVVSETIVDVIVCDHSISQCTAIGSVQLKPM